MHELVTNVWLWWTLLLVVAATLAYRGAPRLVWTIALGLVVASFYIWAAAPWVLKVLLLGAYLLPALLFNIPLLRRTFFAKPLLRFYRNAMPEISATERAALEAGTTWWDAELFTGRPDWRKLLDFETAQLSAEEQVFLAGPVETLCGMLNDYRITHQDRDLPPEAWAFIKEQGFFGMLIPKVYGGKEFCAAAHAAVVMKIATRSISAALTVMIPNSVGPAKLLMKYGTEQQKNHYLPRLAKAEDIPCFALTATEAGSDAGAIPDSGIVCKGEFDGKKDVLGIRLNFDKRYITLAPVATVLGLAFKLYDPDGLLGDKFGKKKNLGITLALVPTRTPGIEQGERHNPMQMAFMNGPVRGTDVFIPLDWIIGGVDQAGRGWRMLMECLTDGRSISLPALSTASAKVAARAAGSYARVREQFKKPIGEFEGIQEALARIAGNTYAMDATRDITLAALDAGHKPSVIAGIAKYNLTERARQVINDAIEIWGGAGVCMGPRNPLGQLYLFPPVGVTVEGHNILTRSLMVFGQGAIRCHPYLLRELEAAQNTDNTAALTAFDKAMTAHVGFALRNACRTLMLGLTGARLTSAPAQAGGNARHYRQLNRMSAAFALVTDALLLLYRGSIKRRERLSGRMADIISQLYIASTALKRHHDLSQPHDEQPLVDWVVADALNKMQQGFDRLLANLDNRFVTFVLRQLVFPLGRRYAAPSDTLEQALAILVQQPGPVRERLLAGSYFGADDRLVELEQAMTAMVEAAPLRTKLRNAIRSSAVQGLTLEAQLIGAVTAGQLSVEEAEQLREMDRLRLVALQVDEF